MGHSPMATDNSTTSSSQSKPRFLITDILERDRELEEDEEVDVEEEDAEPDPEPQDLSTSHLLIKTDDDDDDEERRIHHPAFAANLPRKPRKPRTAFTDSQLQSLERAF